MRRRLYHMETDGLLTLRVRSDGGTGWYPGTGLPPACRTSLSPAPQGAASADLNDQGQHGGRAMDAMDPL